MNGRHFPESKRKVGENASPFHPWCRYTTAPYSEDLKGIGTRWMRNPETGKGGSVPADMTYQEWKEIYVDKKYTFEEWEKKRSDAKISKAIQEQQELFKKYGSAENIMLFGSEEDLIRWSELQKITGKSEKNLFKDESKYGIVKEIKKPPPKSLENFDKYEEEWRNTNYDQFTDTQKVFIRQNLQELFDNSEYHLAINPDTLEKVVDSGRFMNQFETGSSRGLFDNDIRKKATKQLFGSDVDTMSASDFEKYGYLGHMDFVVDASDSNARQYGSAIVRFKKESLNDRVTYTLGDSLGGAMSQTHIAGHDGQNVTISGIEDSSYVRSKVLNSRLIKVPGSMTHNPHELADETRSGYIELQYHGDLLLSDVQSVCFRRDPPQTLINKLKGLKIKTYKIEGGHSVEI